jgi:UDP-glucose 4-epimerase
MVRHLQDNNFQALVLDNLSSGFANATGSSELIQGDVGDAALLNQIFTERSVHAVMHFASFIQVGESVTHPGKYYENNVGKAITLLNAMARHGVRHFIFSSTAAIFGNPVTDQIAEDHPMSPINPYGRSKLLVEQLLPDYDAAYGMHFVCLRYFNAAGAQPDGSLGERHDPETHLIPLAIQAALGKGNGLKLFGTDYPTSDGTCVRDYIHVCDLAVAHLQALRHLQAGGQSLQLNLGTGSGYSVKQILDAVGQVVGRLVPHEVLGRRSGDPAVLVADARKAKELLGWQPAFSLNEIVAHAVAWHASR